MEYCFNPLILPFQICHAISAATKLAYEALLVSIVPYTMSTAHTLVLCLAVRLSCYNIDVHALICNE